MVDYDRQGDYFINEEKNTGLLPTTEAENGTIFDDVFRTIAQKMPQLLIPLINEVFQTDYSEKQEFVQLRKTAPSSAAIPYPAV